MEEPILKKKNFIKRMIGNQFFVTAFSFVLMMFVIIGSSYALLNDTSENMANDVTISSGNLQVVVTSSTDMLILNYENLGISDEVGLKNEPYIFTIKNTGDADIGYYEIRIVDKEYEISNLPHKSINYAISKNSDNYTNPENLGDSHGYVYIGNNLKKGATETFNLKLWVNEEFGKYANNKTLKASLEVTLYNDIPTRNYLIYNTQGGSLVSKTSVGNKKITNQIPNKDGYEFIGWSTKENSNSAEYQSGDNYGNNNGIVLYAVWKSK